MIKAKNLRAKRAKPLTVFPKSCIKEVYPDFELWNIDTLGIQLTSKLAKCFDSHKATFKALIYQDSMHLWY